MYKFLKLTFITGLLILNFQTRSNPTSEKYDSGYSDEKKLSLLKTTILQAKLLPEPNLVGGDGSEYGFSVAIDGNRALVGAEKMAGHGLVFVLEFVGGAWVETDVLIPEDGISDDRFGASVDLDGDRAIIGADGVSDIVNFRGAGAAYIFDFSTGTWTQSAKLIPNDADTDDQFGFSVSVSGDNAIIGSKLDNSVTLDAGSAYIFTRNASNIWLQTQKLTAPDAGISDNFGFSVSIDGTRAIAGAIFAGNNSAGAVYVYDLNGTWMLSKILSGTGNTFGDNFGQSSSLLGNRILVGANGDDQQASSAGAAYIFDFDSMLVDWVLTQKLFALDAASGDIFGKSVSLTTDRAIIGADGDDNVFAQSGSAYIFDLDVMNGTWGQTDKIVSNSPGGGDLFGGAVAISGEAAIIGALRDDDVGDSSGSASVFKNNLGSWSQDSIHNGGDGAAGDAFGASISVSGDWAVASATGDDDNGQRAGAVYFYQLISGVWTFKQKLLASDGDDNDSFGSAVSLFGNKVIIGASSDEVNGVNSGSAYIFELVTGVWIETQKILPSDGAPFHSFGLSVSLFGDRAIVSSPFGKVSGVQTGLVYVFELDGGGLFVETAKIFANDRAAFDQFGTSISLGNNRAIIGADRDGDNGFASGSAYIFDFTSIWSQTTKLLPNNGAASDAFGASVSLSGDRALIGAINTDGNGSSSGSAYVFELDAMGWSQIQELTATNAAAADQFGVSVALSNNKALIGALKADSNGVDSGSSYVFEADISNNWTQTELIIPASVQARDGFGFRVALEGNQLFVSATGDDDNGTSSGSVYTIMIELPDLMFLDGFE